MGRHRLTPRRLNVDERAEIAAGWFLSILGTWIIATVIDGVTAHGVIRALGIPA